MKNKSSRLLNRPKPSENDIRDYAYHLYQQSNCVPGHDLDNWLEATACLKANIPSHRSGTRLHHHFNGLESGEFSLLSAAARIPLPDTRAFPVTGMQNHPTKVIYAP